MLLGIVLRRPVLNLNDDSGRGRIQLHVGSNGAPMLDLIDAAGNPLIGMAIDPTGPNIGLMDAGSKAGIAMQVLPGGPPGVHLTNARGKVIWGVP